MSVTYPNFGSNGFHWPNSGTTQHTILPLSVLHLRHYMTHHYLLHQTSHTSDNVEVQTTLADSELFTELLKEKLAAAQNRMKHYADKNRTHRVFQVGEQVLLKLQPYVQSSLVNRPCPKLAMKYFGPYTMLERVGSSAYRLDLPAESQIHPVFHTSQLKEFHPDYSPVFSDLPSLRKLDSSSLEPEIILDSRLTKKGNTAITQVLVKWTSLPTEMATWEDYYVLKNHYPSAAA